METDKLFTGRQDEPGDSALSLYNYKARFYSTTLGRFVSADPIARIGNLDRHAYVGNNPSNFIDPTGFCFKTPSGETLPCGYEEALTWLECAFTCPNDGPLGPLRDFARGGLQQGLYWENVFRIGLGNGPFLAETVMTIGRNYNNAASLEIIPPIGYATIGRLLGVTGTFFKSSLFDLLAGTNSIVHLPERDLIGAYPWWDVGLGW
jgi:RHS repeat-associated protein